jgi:aspartate aminotransferase
MSQVAAVTALEGPQQCVADARQLFERRRNRMAELLNGIRGIRCFAPDGAFYVFASVAGLFGATTPAGRKLSSDADVMMYFTEAAGVATIDGTSYGLPAHLRLSFATAIEQIEAGCAALARAARALHFSHVNEEPSHA